MQDDRPSVTAYRVALRRAAHQILDDPKVLDDPLALAIVGAERMGLICCDGSPPFRWRF